ncbi:MAG: hypothetical protein IJ848_04215 [Alphaproteobacteria bacterium]|nr:hypothetical protein [Alphaproteobacteria bacterium]
MSKEETSKIFNEYNNIKYSSNPIIDTCIADINCKTLYDVIILNIVQQKLSSLFTKNLINQPIQIIEFKKEQITDSLMKTLNHAGYNFIRYYKISDIRFIDNKLIVEPTWYFYFFNLLMECVDYIKKFI